MGFVVETGNVIMITSEVMDFFLMTIHKNALS